VLFILLSKERISIKKHLLLSCFFINIRIFAPFIFLSLDNDDDDEDDDDDAHSRLCISFIMSFFFLFSAYVLLYSFAYFVHHWACVLIQEISFTGKYSSYINLISFFLFCNCLENLVIRFFILTCCNTV
jgi:hypothetical protein